MAVQRIHIKRSVTSIARLPISRSAIARAATEWTRQEATDPTRFADTVFVDPGLAIALLRAYYGEPVVYDRFPSPREVLAALGPLQVRRIVAANAVVVMLDRPTDSREEVFTDMIPQLRGVYGDSYHHAIATAICARLVVQHVPVFLNAPARLADCAYLAGLVHDLGKFVLLRLLEPELATVPLPDDDLEEWWRTVEERWVPHTLAGKWYAESLQLPERFCRILWQHHLPANERDQDEETEPLFVALDLARRLAGLMVAKEDATPRSAPRIWKEYELGEQRFMDLLDTCRAATQSVIQSLSFADSSDEDQLRAVLNVLETDARLAPGHAVTLQRAARYRAIHRLYQTVKNKNAFDDIHRQIVDHIREELRIAPGICCVTDQNAGQLILRVWKSFSDVAQRIAVPLDASPHAPEQAALFGALHALGLGVGPEGWAGTALRDVANWGGIVAVPMLVQGTCYGQIVFDAAMVRQPLGEDEFDDLLAFGAACGLLVSQQQERERLAVAGERHIETAQREAELLRRLRAAERLATAGERSALAAQALNTPLSLALAQLEWFLNRTADARARQALDPVLRQTRTACRAVRDLLFLARAPQPRLEPALLNYLLHQAVAQASESVSSRGCQFVEDYADGLPRVQADRRLLEHAFVNILIHCSEGLGHAGVNVTVQTWAGPDRRAVFARIARTSERPEGGPRSESFVPRADDRFIETPAGISLTVAQEILETHGGTLEIETLPAGGCAFTLQLPAAATRASRVAPESRRNVPRRLRCLVVDDEPAVRDILAEALKTRNVESIPAADGVEALHAIEQQPFDFIISDVQMPRLDGLAFLRALRSSGNPTPLILITGSQDIDTLEEAIQTGATAYIKKPFQLKNLFEQIDALLARLTPQPR